MTQGIVLCVPANMVLQPSCSETRTANRKPEHADAEAEAEAEACTVTLHALTLSHGRS